MRARHADGDSSVEAGVGDETLGNIAVADDVDLRHVQPAIDTPEARALTDAAPGWIDDYALVTDDTKLPQLLAESGAVLIGYRQLRDAMRDG